MTAAVEPRCGCLHSRWRHLADHGHCQARYCQCVRFKTPAPDFTADERATVHRFENTRPAPESYRPDDTEAS